MDSYKIRQHYIEIPKIFDLFVWASSRQYTISSGLGNFEILVVELCYHSAALQHFMAVCSIVIKSCQNSLSPFIIYTFKCLYWLYTILSQNCSYSSIIWNSRPKHLTVRLNSEVIYGVTWSLIGKSPSACVSKCFPEVGTKIIGLGLM